MGMQGDVRVYSNCIMKYKVMMFTNNKISLYSYNHIKNYEINKIILKLYLIELEKKKLCKYVTKMKSLKKKEFYGFNTNYSCISRIISQNTLTNENFTLKHFYNKNNFLNLNFFKINNKKLTKNSYGINSCCALLFKIDDSNLSSICNDLFLLISKFKLSGVLLKGLSINTLYLEGSLSVLKNIYKIFCLKQISINNLEINCSQIRKFKEFYKVN